MYIPDILGSHYPHPRNEFVTRKPKSCDDLRGSSSAEIPLEDEVMALGTQHFWRTLGEVSCILPFAPCSQVDTPPVFNPVSTRSFFMEVRKMESLEMSWSISTIDTTYRKTQTKGQSR